MGEVWWGDQYVTEKEVFVVKGSDQSVASSTLPGV